MPSNDIVGLVDVALYPKNVTDHCDPAANPVSVNVTVETAPLFMATKPAVSVPGPFTTAVVDALVGEAMTIDPDDAVQVAKL